MCQLWVRFADGVEGVVSLKHLVGKGVFWLWDDKETFLAVAIDPFPVEVAPLPPTP